MFICKLVLHKYLIVLNTTNLHIVNLFCFQSLPYTASLPTKYRVHLQVWIIEVHGKFSHHIKHNKTISIMIQQIQILESDLNYRQPQIRQDLNLYRYMLHGESFADACVLERDRFFLWGGLSTPTVVLKAISLHIIVIMCSG